MPHRSRCTLTRVQRGLEALYRVNTGCAVGDFVVGTEYRDELVHARRAREQLLVVETDGELNVALYLEPSVISNLDSHDPSHRLGDHNLGDFLLAIEGVSHFIYTVCCARAERRVSQLELELQAEVDKYLLVLEALTHAPAANRNDVRDRLFGRVRFLHAAGSEQGDRYRMANHLAARFVGTLSKRHHTSDSPRERVRRFFDAGQREKIEMVMAA